MDDLRIVHLALSPKAARLLDEVIEYAESFSAYRDSEILYAIRADIKEQLPKKSKSKTKTKTKRKK